MAIGDKVRWRYPQCDAEAKERYTVIELNGDRCMIRYVCSLPIPPVSLALVADLESA
jgi:hypothetical protein